MAMSLICMHFVIQKLPRSNFKTLDFYVQKKKNNPCHIRAKSCIFVPSAFSTVNVALVVIIGEVGLLHQATLLVKCGSFSVDLGLFRVFSFQKIFYSWNPL